MKLGGLQVDMILDYGTEASTNKTVHAGGQRYSQHHCNSCIHPLKYDFKFPEFI
jgi:hypothetical protein